VHLATGSCHQFGRSSLPMLPVTSKAKPRKTGVVSAALSAASHTGPAPPKEVPPVPAPSTPRSLPLAPVEESVPRSPSRSDAKSAPGASVPVVPPLSAPSAPTSTSPSVEPQAAAAAISESEAKVPAIEKRIYGKMPALERSIVESGKWLSFVCAFHTEPQVCQLLPT